MGKQMKAYPHQGFTSCCKYAQKEKVATYHKPPLSLFKFPNIKVKTILWFMKIIVLSFKK